MRIIPKPLHPWIDCRLCGLHRTRRKVVFGRGTIPADVLFLGIGPGMAEDVLGRAFVGPSGKIVDESVKDASQKAGWTPRCYFANLVACRPTDTKTGVNRDPFEDEMMACRPRLMKTVDVVRPQKIILLGETVKVEARKLFPDAELLPHPASVLYSGGRFCHAIQTVAYRRFWMALWAIFERARKEMGE